MQLHVVKDLNTGVIAFFQYQYPPPGWTELYPGDFEYMEFINGVLQLLLPNMPATPTPVLPPQLSEQEIRLIAAEEVLKMSQDIRNAMKPVDTIQDTNTIVPVTKAGRHHIKNFQSYPDPMLAMISAAMCDCGSAKAGLPTHSSWCMTNGAKKP